VVVTVDGYRCFDLVFFNFNSGGKNCTVQSWYECCNNFDYVILFLVFVLEFHLSTYTGKFSESTSSFTKIAKVPSNNGGVH
jgi:hypothetical protein